MAARPGQCVASRPSIRHSVGRSRCAAGDDRSAQRVGSSATGARCCTWQRAVGFNTLDFRPLYLAGCAGPAASYPYPRNTMAAAIPVLLVSTATRWYGTARTPRALAKAGFEVTLLTP